MSLSTWIHTEELKAVGITKQIWDWLCPQLKTGFADAVAAAEPIVLPIVLGLAADPTKSGVQKAAAALNAAKPQLIAAGLSAETNIINAAIASAVSKLPTTPAAVTLTTPTVAGS